MPNVNLTDSRNRDAVVKAETTGVDEEVRYVDEEGQSAYTRKILKATVEQDFESLVGKHDGDAEVLGRALVDGDPEVDMEICGLYLWGVSKVYVDSSDGIVYRIEQQEIVRGPDGSVREKRARNRPEANVDSDIPLTWTGRKIDKQEAVRRFVFASKLQIVHINGLTYDFLYGMAQELAESNSLMMVGGGSKGRDPLVFRRGSVPYRGFLEGRIDGDKYLLLLHLSNLELKVPSAMKETSRDTTVSDETKLKEPADKKSATTGKKKTGKAEVVKTAESASKKADEPTGPKELKGEKAAESSGSKKTRAKNNAASSGTDKVAVQNVDSKIQDKTKKVEPKKEKPVKEKPVKEKPVKEKPVKDKPKGGRQKAAKSEGKPKTKKSKDQTSPDEKSDNKSTDSSVSAAKNVEQAVPEKPMAVTSEDLGIWLKSIRMGKYLQLFIDNEIDVDVLTELTDEDLKELEIPLGSRRRLLKAVEETDNLHAEVAMAVNQMTGTKAGAKKSGRKSDGQSAGQKK